ncbi:MAG: hypothetical protein AAF865_01595 [Pseudomonadota bacterium]
MDCRHSTVEEYWLPAERGIGLSIMGDATDCRQSTIIRLKAIASVRPSSDTSRQSRLGGKM